MEHHEVVPVFGQRPEDILTQRRAFRAARPTVTPDFSQQARRLFGTAVVKGRRFKLLGYSLNETVLQDGDRRFFKSEFLSDFLVLPMGKKQKVERLEVSKSTFGLQSVGGGSDCLEKLGLVIRTLLFPANVPTG